jgi:hypothetical protein
MATKKSKKKNNTQWFISVRGSYLPNNHYGWLSYLPYTTFLLISLIFTWRLNASEIIRIYLVVIQWAFAFLFMTLLAKNRS